MANKDFVKVKVLDLPAELTPEEWTLAKDLANQEDDKNSCPTRTLPKSPSANSGSALPA